MSILQSQDYLLRAAFAVQPHRLAHAYDLLMWLADYHAQNDAMPDVLQGRLLSQLQKHAQFSGWPLAELLGNIETFRKFVQENWERYITQAFGESEPGYDSGPLDFAGDRALQDVLPRLVREGAITPLQVVTQALIPVWAQTAVAVNAAGVREQQVLSALDALQADLKENDLRWERWQMIAQRWAQTLLRRFGEETPLSGELAVRYELVQTELDRRFLAWLQTNYAALAVRQLPQPHHLFHVLRYLQQQRQPGQRLALLILDGMALADWLLIRQTWEQRHSDWHPDEHLVLAQIPTITAISRQALVSGLRPVQFTASLTHQRREQQHWQTFWAAQGLAADGCVLVHLPDQDEAPLAAELDSTRIQALCCITSVIDDMSHGATQGASDVLASIRLWLDAGSHRLEHVITRLLDREYAVYLTSDHGHVACLGYGQPQEGVLVESAANAPVSMTMETLPPSSLTSFPIR